MPDTNRWIEIVTEDPEHSTRYIERFEQMEAEGRDLGGEVRMVDAMVARGSRILDAGCGPGRVGGRLHGLGHTVVGVDIDPVLIDAAAAKYPGPTWRTGDLATADLSSAPIGGNFDVVVSAGNVMRFLAPDTRVAVLRNMASALQADGRLVVGFGSGGGEYDNDDFFHDAASARLSIDACFSTWDLRPFSTDSEFLVAILSR